jgi:hypothetical protein
MRTGELPEEVMNDPMLSLALTGVVPAACDAEAGEAGRQVLALGEMPRIERDWTGAIAILIGAVDACESACHRDSQAPSIRR